MKQGKSILLSARDLTKVYGSGDNTVCALDKVSLDIYSGCFLSIAGNSGSGKTTLLNMLGAIDTPDSGQLLFSGDDITKYSDKKKTIYRRDKVSFIFQEYNLFDDLTVYENILLACGKNQKQLPPKDALDRLGILSKADKYPAQLSGGERQRVAIARALAKRSELLLCDEPTGALDSENEANILKILQKTAHENDLAVVIVSHNPAVEKIADHVVRLKNGKVIEDYKNPDAKEIKAGAL